jgi:hypothetical protein
MESLAAFIERHFLSCSFKSLLGMECPGCGMQRAFVALLRGDLFLSLSLNPSLIPFIITIAYAAAHLLTGFRNGARNIVWLFSFTVLVMVVNFVIKLLSGH